MKSTKQFTEEFMEKLNNDEFKLEKEPAIQGSELIGKFIVDELSKYEKLLKLDLLKKIENEESLILSLKK